MAALRAIREHIIFQFIGVEIVRRSNMQNRTQFQETTDWGFQHTSFDESLNIPRWANVLAVGPEVSEEIKPGMVVLVDALKWTPGLEMDGQTYWRTDEQHILAVDDSVDHEAEAA